MDASSEKWFDFIVLALRRINPLLLVNRSAGDSDVLLIISDDHRRHGAVIRTLTISQVAAWAETRGLESVVEQLMIVNQQIRQIQNLGPAMAESSAEPKGNP